jgi:hypothetical protein
MIVGFIDIGEIVDQYGFCSKLDSFHNYA